MALTIPRHLTLPYLLNPAAATILSLALILHVHLATAQTTPLPWLVCNTTVNYTENSAYQANLHRLATTLPSNASSSPALFAIDAAGTAAPDTVYALALCRGDTNDTSGPPYSINPDDIQSIDDSLLLDLSTLRKATNNFAESNKLGEGGFGAVYKYSVKSDVFSLGVLVLEILTGTKNSSSFANPEESVGLLRLVWEHWTAGTTEELMDPFLDCRPPHDQMLKLVCIGLLCTQDNPANWSTMSSVNVMLSSNTVSLEAPSRPTFYDAYSRAFQSASNLEVATSRNEASLTVTELEPR
ncbi:hypothetical protein PR202_gb23984 [Eleusine coracana subsp. coracana]|uniref:Gnk2-homologous domain-containing protein n=1 Tax=Eleusine coracana subsp. coracana TaxID=191504 RepID=A0AAV5FHM7_ELECO|nr:hypothetical protein PR202_gb23984 [Eleusine coracana subsp. coracana]